MQIDCECGTTPLVGFCCAWRAEQWEQEQKSQWQDDDEVVTTFRTIKMMQAENYDAGFAAGVAWAEAQVKAGA
jgi:hypothetical protein